MTTEEDGDLSEKAAVKSPKRLARIAGVLYLLVGIFGGFAEGFVDPKVYVAGNAATTAGNVVANSGLVRLGVVAHLLDGTFFVFLAMSLYVLLRHVNKNVARAMLVLVALATGIICLNAVFQFECPGAAPPRHPAPWDPHRAGLLRPVAGTARLSSRDRREYRRAARARPGLSSTRHRRALSTSRSSTSRRRGAYHHFLLSIALSHPVPDKGRERQTDPDRSK